MRTYVRLILVLACASAQCALHIFVYRARSANPTAPITLLTSGFSLFIGPMLLGGIACGLILGSRRKTDRGLAAAVVVAGTIPIGVCAGGLGLPIDLSGWYG